ncbi:coenzyme F420-0:L-glutamate ligase [Micromonospora krabiensis]|uniref:Coenzyme F420-0:L-glutamate ligase / coenzyme F420-1:gamma-L-glutamate ligase n=1 Tax=Micromonospora krabiensis TaxID=307121 RepID=A0A1C3N5I6_9ACTN|nr:coenzyme F420-0:L-glutamate ligase [Micromonospora krabiensis]SBV27859.1 coenzyme F420-0:L-glutamate ligase / coenzyme F420-1:gamma-L-glutamate ligase [Micromonospora krabiensis]
MRLEILPVLGIGHVSEGDDLAAVIATAAPWLRDGDVLVVTSKIVSKSEGQLVDVPADGPERQTARDEVLAAETARVVATRGATRIVQTHHGFVMASAGIDASNVDKTRLVLLPKDPDASARALRAALRARYDLDVAVVISDTMGRPWRNGLTDVALGVAGMSALRDHRGEVDPYGNELQLTQMAVVDELAAAGELIKGKIDQVPVAVVRGYLTAARPDEDEAGAAVLVRDAAQDLFSLGTAEARTAGLVAAMTLPDGPGDTPADPAAVRRAIDAVAGVVAPGTVFTLVADDDDVRAGLVAAVPGWPDRATTLVLGSPPTPVDTTDLVRFGADVHRLRVALAVEGVPSLLLPPPAGSTASAALAL